MIVAATFRQIEYEAEPRRRAQAASDCTSASTIIVTLVLHSWCRPLEPALVYSSDKAKYSPQLFCVADHGSSPPRIAITAAAKSTGRSVRNTADRNCSVARCSRLLVAVPRSDHEGLIYSRNPFPRLFVRTGKQRHVSVIEKRVSLGNRRRNKTEGKS